MFFSRKYLTSLFFIAGLILSACQPGEAVEDKLAAAHARNDAPAIWEVKDADSTLYLFGTVHLLPAGLIWQRDDMRDAFGEAGTVFFEVDSGEAGQVESARLTQALGFLGPNERLEEQLDDYQTKLLFASANNADLPYETLNSMRPWLASEFLTVAAAQNAGLSAALAADEALKTRARQHGKHLRYLDSIDSQIRASADQPQTVQMLLLTDTMERLGSMGTDLSYMAEAWSVGQVDILERKTVDSLKKRSPELYTALIVKRNESWAEQLAGFMEGSGTGFAAVGIAHLLGPDNLQTMLETKGYRVKRFYAFQGEPVIRPVWENGIPK